MNWNGYGRVLVGLLVAPAFLASATLAGCGGDKKKKKKDDDEKEEPKKDDKKPASTGTAVATSGGAPTGGPSQPPPPASGGGGGEAYFVVDGVGLVQIASDGKISVIAGTEDAYVHDLTLGGDGKVYVASSRGIGRIEGTSFKQVAPTDFDDIGSVSEFTVAKDGTIFAAGYQKIGKYDGKKWELEKVDSFLPKGKDFIYGVGIDAAGKFWVTTSEAAWVKDPTWTEVKPPGRNAFLHEIRQDGQGNLYTYGSDDLFKLADKKADKQDTGVAGYLFISKFAMASNGSYAFATGKKVHVKPQGGQLVKYEGPKDFAVDSIKALGVDEQNRAWVAHYSGIAVLGPSGAKTEWLTGSFAELSGDIREIVVTKGGPALPQSAGQKKVASLKGKIVLDNEAIGKTDVEICPSPSWLISGTPCGESPIKFTGQSNDSGEFEFKDVPLGSYGVAFKGKDGKWMTTFGNRTSKMREGQNYDMGSINVKSPKK